ncbi:GNAT family N-acetyltransferase [soil metagenome]
MDIQHDPAGKRFSTRLGSGEAYVQYEERGPETLDLLHTIVPPAEQGKGVGSSLVRHVFEYARERGYRIIPSCPFTGDWLRDNPEYNEVSARS